MSQGGGQPISRRVTADTLTPWGALLVDAFNLVQKGKINAMPQSTINLTANATSTTLTDERIGPASWIWFMPTTAHGATALQNVYITARLKGSCTINHASSANTDQTLYPIIIG